MSTSELACTYASLILSDDGIPITADKIATLLASKSIGDLVANVGSGGGGGGGAAAADGPAAGGAAAAKAPEPEPEEEEEDMGFDLFD